MCSISAGSTTYGDDFLTVRRVECKSALSISRLPGLDWALNPYRGCSHSCAYCYAQDVTRFELGSPWGEVVEAKINIVSKLERELAKASGGVIGIGTVTDPYQPAEEDYRLTRSCLERIAHAGTRASILTKADLILRDLDILTRMDDVEVGVSIGICDESLASVLEPRAPRPKKRFEVLRSMSENGIDAYLMAAPIIPGIADSQESLRALIRNASAAGVKRVLWDRFNSKPMASARLSAALAARNLPEPRLWTSHESEAARRVLSTECEMRGIQLLDAF
jgi:DNA repair photolyase